MHPGPLRQERTHILPLQPMYLVLCASSDFPALWACRELRAIGFNSVEVVTSDMLALSTLWDHHLGAPGIGTAFNLPDGRRVACEQIRGVLNRLLGPPEVLIAQAVLADREYVQQELTALYLSWLNAIAAPVINRPTPQGLAGRWRHAAEWAKAAYQAGFIVPAYRQTGHDKPERGYASLGPADVDLTRVIVLDGVTFGACLPDDIQQSCRRLAEDVGTALLGIDLFKSAADSWCFAGATPLPDLQVGGLALVRRLGQIFGSRFDR